MLTSTIACVATLGCVVIIYLEQWLKKSRSQLRLYPLPPGPSGLPWVGNVLGIDAAAPWLTYRKWAKTYGDIVYSRLLGKDIIIVDSEKVAKDLLELRARNYSDRPYLITSELCGVEFSSSLLPYGDVWRLHRRFFHQTFRSGAMPRFYPLQLRKSCQLLQQLLNTPDQFSDHIFECVLPNELFQVIFTYTTSLILSSIYDYDPVSRQDELLGIVPKVLEVILPATQPEVALIVGAFPFLLWLPSWFPGMSFKTKMAVARQFAYQYVEKPFEYSVQKLRSNTGSAPSMVLDYIRKNRRGDTFTDEPWMKELKFAAASGFVGGSETSNSVIMLFFLVMVLNPEAQQKAQAQIDRLLGEERLPTLNDRPALPYVDAILREVYRYNPVVPLSVPHVVADDDIYAGYHIPKGALIITNLWSMAHDESRYPSPEMFMPERFLADDGSLLPDSTEHIAFGFGRRICPGRHLADTAVWSAISSVLAIFRISKLKDANGVEIPVEPKFSRGVSAHPLPFACSIIPRKPGMDAMKLQQLIDATTLAH